MCHQPLCWRGVSPPGMAAVHAAFLLWVGVYAGDHNERCWWSAAVSAAKRYARAKAAPGTSGSGAPTVSR
ncbi:MAG TPA: hypothetical protein VH590_13470, partial [Ktedonobacterales bacterium]